MKLLNIIALLVFMSMISCRENKNTSSNKSQTSATQQPASTTQDTSVESSVENENPKPGDSLMAVIVSFYSIGQGIDRGQTEKLKGYLQTYEKRSGKKIEYSVVYWGREGETDFCFPLTGFSDNQVIDFLKGAKDALNTAEHVHFLQKQVCRKGR